MPYPVIVEELEFYLDVRSELLELNFLLIKPELSLGQPELVDLGLPGRAVELQVGPVRVILYPGSLVHLHRGQAVLHRLVHDRVHGAHEEVEAGQQLLAVLGQVPLGLGVEEEFLLQFR